MDQIDSAYKVLSISRQCKLLGISRRQYYYDPSSEQNEKKFNLLVKIKVIRYSNQVWSTDITYIKLPTGNVYLMAIIDWFSRKVLIWRVFNTMDALQYENLLRKQSKNTAALEFSTQIREASLHLMSITTFKSAWTKREGFGQHQN